MTVDIFKFWARVALSEKVHPADREVLSRIKHGFDTKCLPNCMMGPLRTAPVVMLYLSPGLSKQDYSDARSVKGQSRYRRVRTGRQPLPGPEVHQSAFNWWRQRTNAFSTDWQILCEKVAFLNIGAYHSRTFDDISALASLPSSRASLEWAQETLFPEAIRGERIVICLRSPRFWGLEPGTQYGQALFAPRTTRGGHMHHGAMRSKIIAKVRRKLGLPNAP